MNVITQIDRDTRAPFTARYDNFIGGSWRAPAAGRCDGHRQRTQPAQLLRP